MCNKVPTSVRVLTDFQEDILRNMGGSRSKGPIYYDFDLSTYMPAVECSQCKRCDP
jgi:hypothetical protein